MSPIALLKSSNSTVVFGYVMLANTTLIVPESVAFAAISIVLLILNVEAAAGIRANTAGAVISVAP